MGLTHGCFRRRRTHPGDRRLRNSGTGKPPQPQFSSSTSSITTKVESSGFCSTSSRSWLTPAMSEAFSSAVTEERPGPDPSRVTWLVTIGMMTSLGDPPRSPASVPGALTAIDVQDLAGHEIGGLQEHHGLHDVLDLPHVPHRVEGRQEL